MNLANVTRLHNITASVSAMRRMIALLEDYSYKRKVFNNYLYNKPLHILSVSQMKFCFLICLSYQEIYIKADNE